MQEPGHVGASVALKCRKGVGGLCSPTFSTNYPGTLRPDPLMHRPRDLHFNHHPGDSDAQSLVHFGCSPRSPWLVVIKVSIIYQMPTWCRVFI